MLPGQILLGGEGAVREFQRRNVELITRMGNKTLEDVQKLLQERTFEHPDTLRKAIQERFSVSRARSELWARDQTLKLAGQIQEERQKAAGVTRYIWRTSGDERVRDRHADLDGTTQRWDDPPIVDPRTDRRAHPGGDYQCRCTAEPILEDEPAPTPPPEKPTRTRKVNVSQALARKPVREIVESAGGLGSGAYIEEGFKDFTGPLSAYAGKTPAEVNQIATGRATTGRGRTFSPISVEIAIDNQGQVTTHLIDGRHRLGAAAASGATEILAEVSISRQLKNGKWREIKTETGVFPIGSATKLASEALSRG